MYARHVGDKELTFDFASGLVNDNLLLVDRETSSVWSQLDNKAISGPMKDTPMVVVPAMQSTWRFWKTKHPDSEVMTVEGEKGRKYFYSDWTPGKPRPKKPPTSHDTVNLGLGISVNGESFFLPFRELDRSSTPLHLTIGGVDMAVYYRPWAMTAWAFDQKRELLPTVLAYEAGWKSFHPETKVFDSSRPSSFRRR